MIRALEKGDIDRVMEIWLRANTEAHSFIKQEYWQDNFAEVKEALKTADVFVYEENRSVNGFIGLTDGYIAGLFVDKGFQSTGIGKRLLDYAKERSESLSLDVYVENEGAVRFYLRENFIAEKTHIDKETGKSEIYMSWTKPKQFSL